jgi:glutaredoxin
MGAGIGGGLTMSKGAKGMRALALLVAVGLGVAGGPACKRSDPSAAIAADEPSIAVKPDTEGLLLTWIDDKGDFHVETRVADVPLIGRDCVRVVDPNAAEPTRGDRVVVADLRQATGAGTYPVRAMPRGDFEAMAVARREKAGPTLAGGGSPAPSQDNGAPTAQPPAARPAIRGEVVIYGAEWCGACHDAARYLRRKGVAYVEKDIEKDADAAREMQAKLARSGLRAGSIPVIDVHGKVMVGFNAQEIDAALGTAM